MAKIGLVLLISLLLVTPTCVAKKLYKYQDEQGLWHFTDQQPATLDKVEIRQMKPSRKQRVWLEQSGDQANPAFYVLNHYPGPIEVEIDWGAHNNVIATPPLPSRFVVEPGQSAPLLTVRSGDPTETGHYSLQLQYVTGRPLTDYHSDTLYAPPFSDNSRYQITQGFGGEFSHTDPQNYYAVDIMMPIGTPVYAARGGVVLETEDDYDGNGTELSYASKANSIRILHDDGSMAVYAHLALEKAQVSPGARVETGRLIAYSGNTGLTTGPHLHFAVLINQGMALVSTPFQFRDQSNKAFEPVLGAWLTGKSWKGGVGDNLP